MPQGVEHMHRSQGSGTESNVRIPLMPQGVEHSPRSSLQSRGADREDSIDAARR